MSEENSKSDRSTSLDNRGMDRWSENASTSIWHITKRAPVWRPPTDVYETEQIIMVRVEVAGMSDDDFTIELNGRLLTIRGARPDVPEQRAYHQMEIHFGEFSVDIELPSPIDASRVEAVYSNGFLRVLLPKARPQKIHIVE